MGGVKQKMPDAVPRPRGRRTAPEAVRVLHLTSGGGLLQFSSAAGWRMRAKPGGLEAENRA